MQTIQCPQCQSVIAVPDVQMEVVRGPEVSIVICRHAHHLDCPACDAYMTSGVALADVQVGWKLDKRPEDASRIILAHYAVQ